MKKEYYRSSYKIWKACTYTRFGLENELSEHKRKSLMESKQEIEERPKKLKKEEEGIELFDEIKRIFGIKTMEEINQDLLTLRSSTRNEDTIRNYFHSVNIDMKSKINNR
jgi:hypothetical protein